MFVFVVSVDNIIPAAENLTSDDLDLPDDESVLRSLYIQKRVHTTLRLESSGNMKSHADHRCQQSDDCHNLAYLRSTKREIKEMSTSGVPRKQWRSQDLKAVYSKIQNAKAKWLFYTYYSHIYI